MWLRLLERCTGEGEKANPRDRARGNYPSPPVPVAVRGDVASRGFAVTAGRRSATATAGTARRRTAENFNCGNCKKENCREWQTREAENGSRMRASRLSSEIRVAESQMSLWELLFTSTLARASRSLRQEQFPQNSPRLPPRWSPTGEREPAPEMSPSAVLACRSRPFSFLQFRSCSCRSPCPQPPRNHGSRRHQGQPPVPEATGSSRAHSPADSPSRPLWCIFQGASAIRT